MRLRRLSWAGVEIEESGWRVLVDPLENTWPFRDFAGPPHWRLEPPPIDERTIVLVTHIHHDHCDRGLLARVPAGQSFCHDLVRPALAKDGLTPVGVGLWQTVQVGPVRITPVPAQDWRSDDQVSWVVEADGRRVIHCGDTIWHGQWYAIAAQFGPIDTAFLPINGFVASLGWKGFTATDVPGSLTPEQAVEAAVILRARRACAIHHTMFDNPPHYAQQPRAVERFHAAARWRGIQSLVPGDGQVLSAD